MFLCNPASAHTPSDSQDSDATINLIVDNEFRLLIVAIFYDV